MKAIVLTEKPSVAREIARVLKCTRKQKGFIEGDKYIITWALGHLVTLAEPSDYDDRYKHWSLDYLPMLPEKMKLKVIKKTSDQFRSINRILQRKDVSELIIATDAGREGELVARWIMIKGGWKNKPVKRLWISSQTDSAIREGFANLKPARNYDNLFNAAVGRAEADWLVGLNVTRGLTCKYDARLNAGRVQTPTLSIIVEKENDIKNFVPKKYWQIIATFSGVSATWQDQHSNNRIYDKEKADKLVAKLQNKNGVIISITRKDKSEAPPLAYDLTELQRDANRRYGFSAKHTLRQIQTLYERHKLVSYPRTDSRYITKDMVSTLKIRLQKIAKAGYSSLVQPLLKQNLKLTTRFVNDAKVSDHHAIIPTDQTVNISALSNDEKKIYDLIVRRFITVLYPHHKYVKLAMMLKLDNENFLTNGKVIIEQGWKKVSTQLKDSDDEETEYKGSLPNLKQGQNITISGIKLQTKQTKPPKRFTEATLLTAMENPGKSIEDKVLKESIKAGGLGTPATRADIIEKLIHGYYVERIGKQLVPTAKAFELIRLVPDELKYPELTAEWEFRLSNIALGKENKDKFIKDIRLSAIALTNHIKSSNLKYEITNLSKEKCPLCGNFMMKFTDKLVCSDRQCAHEQSGKQGKGLSTRRKSFKEKKMNKQLISRFGKQKEQTETLGDLFDL
ncbi:MAG: DNA topoisomerase III [Candidatus Cloacimonetes bacterium]|nr:DNA topoisomerase III [Candidatus Cloacimonadota bacterium]